VRVYQRLKSLVGSNFAQTILDYSIPGVITQSKHDSVLLDQSFILDKTPSFMI